MSLNLAGRTAVLAFCLAALAGAPAQANHSDVVISQVYGGGGNAGALYTHDFIELFNRGAAPVSVAGWSVQYGAAGNPFSQRTNIVSGSIAPGQYFLVRQAVGSNPGQPLPTPDVIGSIAMSATAGKVALVTNQVTLACGGPGNSCVTNPAVRDLVGYGTSVDFEGAPTPALSNPTSALRKAAGCTDTDNNAADFDIANPPTPRNTASAFNICGGPPPPTPPRGTGAATPASVPAGATTLLTVAVIPGTNPPSTGLAVTGNLTAIGGAAIAPLFDDGSNGDAVAGDLTFSLRVVVAANTPSGPRTVPFAITDAQARSGSASATISVQAVVRRIHEIQGAGSRSPYAGQLVTTHGIVTARTSNGFFVQSADGAADSDPATSEGLFVFTSNPVPAAAAVGNEVAVTGTVTEFVPSADPVSPPVTELSGFATVTVVSTPNPLPTPVELEVGGVPGELYEQLEGMRVHVASLTVVAPTAGFVSEPNATSTSSGVFYAVVTGTDRPMREPGIPLRDPLPPNAPPDVPRFDENLERIRVDSDGQAGAAPVEVSTGAVIEDFVAIVDFSFRAYSLLPDPGEIADSVGMAIPVPVPAADEFTVASFNLERWFDTVNDPGISEPVLTAAAFARRLQKASLAIRTVMRSPDIIGVAEAEHEPALAALAARVNADAIAAGDPDPGYVARVVEGNDVGGIDVGFLVRTDRVTIVDVVQHGRTATYQNPNGQQELLNDRPPLVLRALVSVPGGPGYPVTVVANHLRSLIGVGDPVDGPRVRAKRVAQAEYLAGLLDTLQAAGPRAAVVAVGDFNAFEVNDGFADVMGIVKGDPAPADEVVAWGGDHVEPDFTNLIGMIADATQRYSYSFDGNAQTLDHVLVSQPLSAKLRRFTYARNDADFPESLRNVATRPERISDHDMPVAFFRQPQADIALAKASSAAVAGGSVTYTIDAGNHGPDVAEQVTVRDDLPAEVTFEAVVPPGGWTCTVPAGGPGGTVACATDEIESGSTPRILLSARVACGIADGTTITNTAVVTSSWDPAAANNSGAASVQVSNPPPTVSGAGVDRPVLWPPNHRMVDVAVRYDVADNCDAAPSCSLAVTSNEPVNGTGDGDRAPDWAIVDAHRVQLRAERAGSGNGRVYTIAIACTDSAGHVGRAQTAVSVPHGN